MFQVGGLELCLGD